MKTTNVVVVVAVLMFIAGCIDQPAGPELSSDSMFTSGQGEGSLARGAVLNFVAPLDGSQEVPPADTDATGVATFQLSRDGESIRYRLIVANIENVTMAHIHVAPAGANGPVVVWLYPDAPPPQPLPGTTNGILAQGTFTADNLVGPLAGESLEALLELMQDAETYVNVHTNQYPAGEIRGQIDRGNGMR